MAASSSKDIQFDKYTVVQLKQMLKDIQLPVSGVKADLVERLIQHHHSTTAIPRKSTTTATPKISTIPKKLATKAISRKSTIPVLQKKLRWLNTDSM